MRRRPRPRFDWLLACGLLALAAPVRSMPAQDPPGFRSGVRLVSVDVSVIDASGDFVRGLVRDDFEILEDGRPQQVAMFSFVDLPMAASPAPADVAGAVEPGVSTTRTADGRSFVVLLDSPSTARAGGGASYDLLVRRVARQFVEQLVGLGDELAIVHVQGASRDSQGFTRNRNLMLASIDRYGTGLSGAGGSIGITRQEQIGRHLDTYRVLQDVAERLGALTGRRKGIVWIGAQLMFAPPDCGPFDGVCQALRNAFPTILAAHRDAMGAANRNNVTVYPVDPAGLTPDLGPGELDRRAALQAVADDTGGIAVVATNDFAAGFRAIVRDHSTYYLLGYVPAVEHQDGAFHRIDVRVKRGGLTVRARKGYLAPAEANRPG